MDAPVLKTTLPGPKAAAIIAWLVLGERLGRVQWVGIAAVAVGVVLLAFGAA